MKLGSQPDLRPPNQGAWIGCLSRAPSSPGVYFFLGTNGELLYIGKARNIRKRLQQHALVKPDANGWINPRYELASEVVWEEAPNEDAASAREADLIVALRPRFNAHSEQGRWNYVLIQEAERGLRFSLSTQLGERKQRAYGCFPHLGKGVSLYPATACSDGYTALLRLFWAASGDGDRTPSRITRSAPETFTVSVDPAIMTAIHRFLKGRDCRVLVDLKSRWSERERYMHVALERDQEAAHGFFIYGPQALRRLRLRHGSRAPLLARPVIEQLLADEVRALFRREGSAIS